MKKTYSGEVADNTDDYNYWPSGRLKTRILERGPSTSYTYNEAGQLKRVDYSDATPDVVYTYDRLGRKRTAQLTDSASNIISTTTYTCDDIGNVLSEQISGGKLDGSLVSRTFPDGRLDLLTFEKGSSSASVDYGYDNAGRLGSIAAQNMFLSYSYHPNSQLVRELSFDSHGTNVTKTSRSYDHLNRLTSISSSKGPSFDYTYNLANQRNRVDMGDGTYWEYTYDSLGQVTSGKHYLWSGEPLAGQQFSYAFDGIGNRTSTGVGGTATGAPLRTASYSVNLANQYTSRTVPNAIDIIGVADPNSTVYVNQSAATRQGEFFHKLVITPNQSSTAWITNINVTSSAGGTPDNGLVFVPGSPEIFSHDLDGNLTKDGHWDYTWDAENRLVKMECRSAINTSSNGVRLRLEFAYDDLGRRTWKKVTELNTSQVVSESCFVYDGWNLIAKLKPQANSFTLEHAFVWGTDLSGTLQGAGGVGGLVCMLDYSPTQPVGYFPTYDGNGNLMSLISEAEGKSVAEYEYGPFGEVLRMTGDLAKTNPFRFSTKYQDDETDLLYYGYRYYNASTGRWLSRDPIGERGGVNLYAFVANNSPKKVDRLGLWAPGTTISCTKNSCTISDHDYTAPWSSWHTQPGLAGTALHNVGTIQFWDSGSQQCIWRQLIDSYQAMQRTRTRPFTLLEISLFVQPDKEDEFAHLVNDFTGMAPGFAGLAISSMDTAMNVFADPKFDWYKTSSKVNGTEVQDEYWWEYKNSSHVDEAMPISQCACVGRWIIGPRKFDRPQVINPYE